MSIDLQLSRHIGVVFGTPLYIRPVEGAETLNAELTALGLRLQAEDSGAKVSNVGGWQSAPTLLQRPEPGFARLGELILEAVGELMAAPRGGAAPAPRVELNAWMNINRPGDYNQLHSHPLNHWAVVYYVAIGRPTGGNPNNGRIELRDPRPAAVHGRVAGYAFGQSIAIEPKPGLMIGFPAWIDHWVHPFQGEGERISIAANVRLLG